MLNLRKTRPVEPKWWQDRVLMAMLLLAVFIHGVLLSIRFVPEITQQAAVKDIAVSLRPTKDAIQHADFLAQHNQQGSGSFREPHRMASDAHALEAIPAVGEQLIEEAEQQQYPQMHLASTVLVTQLSRHVVSADQDRPQQQMLQRQFQRREAQIAGIEAEYRARQQHFSRLQHTKTINGIHAQADPAAAYVEQFRHKVEYVGNRDYPQQAQQQGLRGEVRLMVVLAATGQLRAIELLDSSGSQLLDQAAQASVRRAAPFAAFSGEMTQLQELRIIRTWRFDPEQTEIEIN